MRFTHDQVEERGHEVHYLCAEDVPPSVRGPWGRFTFSFLVRSHIRASRRAGKPYDVVNVHEPSGLAVSALRKAGGFPRVVVTSHGLERRAWELAKEEARLGRQGPKLKTRVIYPLTSLWQSDLALRKADHVFCLNFDDRDYLVRHSQIPAAHITRIYPGADTSFSTATVGRDYSRTDRILFAGTWRKNKGIEDIAPAFAELARRHSALSLTVLGGGVPESLIKASFPGEIRMRVHAIQTNTDAETVHQFASSDLYLLPSLFEGTPLTLIEAMMSGLPIVTTATCGMKDVIRNEENGLLISIRSPAAIVTAIERLLSNPGFRAQLGLTAQRDALQHYTWPHVARPVAEAYERLAGNAPS